MATHPYISGAGNITQMIANLKKTFPAKIDLSTVKKYGLAPNNESYVINTLQFIGLIDNKGEKTPVGSQIMSIHDQAEFQVQFSELIKSAYSDLFAIRGDDAWTMDRDSLIGYFRSADKTGAAIGGRQAAVFMALREMSGFVNEASANSLKKKTSSSGKAKPPKETKKTIKNSTPQANSEDNVVSIQSSKADLALTVRIEINLPAEGTAETYDSIFKSIKANLLP